MSKIKIRAIHIDEEEKETEIQLEIYAIDVIYNALNISGGEVLLGDGDKFLKLINDDPEGFILESVKEKK